MVGVTGRKDSGLVTFVTHCFIVTKYLDWILAPWTLPSEFLGSIWVSPGFGMLCWSLKSPLEPICHFGLGIDPNSVPHCSLSCHHIMGCVDGDVSWVPQFGPHLYVFYPCLRKCLRKWLWLSFRFVIRPSFVQMLLCLLSPAVS